MLIDIENWESSSVGQYIELNMNSINQQANSSKDEELTGYSEESKLEQKDSNEELKNETASSSVRNNEKQLLSSVLPPNDVSKEYENTGPEMEEMSNFSVNATGGSIVLKDATSWAKFSRVNDYQIRFILDLIILQI